HRPRRQPVGADHRAGDDVPRAAAAIRACRGDRGAMNWARVWKRGALVVSFATVLSGLPNVADAEQRHPVRGLVLSVDRSGPAFVVSHEAVSGVMPAMTMPFDVRDAGVLDGIDVGTMVEFTMVA